MTAEASTGVRCHVCGGIDGRTVRNLAHGVTSDCQPWLEPLRMFCCATCGTSQSVVDSNWIKSCEKIYESYDTYAAAGGAEQRVAGATGGGLCGRSAMIVAALARAGLVPEKGCLLDVGCGRGAFLREFASAFPGWAMDGTEFDSRHRDELSGISGFGTLHTGSSWPDGGSYHLVSMIHVLEHFTDPVAALRGLAGIAAPGCLLVVQVPDWTLNPFVLAIADHATHFTAASLARIAREAGWSPIAGVARPVAKELTLVARLGRLGQESHGWMTSGHEDEGALLAGQLGWLSQVEDVARDAAAQGGPLGMFGTAIGATWLHGVIAERISFFVDEDPLRQGRLHLGVPILSPAAIPAGARLIVPLAPVIGDAVLARLAAARPDVGRVPMPAFPSRFDPP